MGIFDFFKRKPKAAPTSPHIEPSEPWPRNSGLPRPATTPPMPPVRAPGSNRMGTPGSTRTVPPAPTPTPPRSDDWDMRSTSAGFSSHPAVFHPAHHAVSSCESPSSYGSSHTSSDCGSSSSSSSSDGGSCGGGGGD